MALPVSSGLFYHIESDSLGLSNGATVTTWPDLTANDNDLAQTGGAALPTYATNSLNGLGGVVFTGAQRMAKVGLNGTPPGARTIFMVVENPPNDGTVKYMTQPEGAGGNLLMAKWSQADRHINGNSDTNFLEFTESGIVSTAGIWTFVFVGTGSFVRWNQVQKVSGNLTTPTAPGAIILGSVGNSGTGFKAYEVAWYTGTLSGGDIDLTEDYLFEKWFMSGPAFPTELHGWEKLATNKLASRRLTIP